MADSPAGHAQHHNHRTATERDPVCGMTVDPARAVSSEYQGQTYYFCCQGCRGKFQDDPQTYLESKKPAQPKDQGPGLYFCPMCPGVEQDHPDFGDGWDAAGGGFPHPAGGMSEWLQFALATPVVLIAVISFGVWSLFGPALAMAHALVAAISVIACPCAMPNCKNRGASPDA